MNGKQLKNSILQWAIQGKLVPQDPNDEPASVLLERIRKEKERLIKEKKIKKDKNASIIFRGDDNSYYEKFLATGVVKCIDDEIPFEIPQGWEWCRLCNLSLLIEDCPHSTVKDEGHGYPLIRTPNIGFGELLLTSVHRVSENVYHKRNVRAVPQPNDLIFAREAPAGNIAVIKENEKVCLGQRTVLIRPILSAVYSKYLAYYILSPQSQQNLIGRSTGTTVAHVNLSSFRPYIIALPPLAEQHRIVTRIEELLPLVEKYNQAQCGLDSLNESIKEQLKKSILQEVIQGRLVPQISEEGTAQNLLEQIKQEKQKLVKEGKLKKSVLTDSIIFKGDDNKYYEQIGGKVVDITDDIPFEIPQTWKWCRFGTIVKMRIGKTPSRGEQIYWSNGTHNWVSISDMVEGGTIKTVKEKVSDMAVNEIFKCYPSPKGSLLMSFKLTVGRTSILGIDAYHNEAIITIVPYADVDNIFRDYLFYILPTISNSGDSKDAIKGKTLNGKSLNSLLIPLPPLLEQKRIVAKINLVNSKIKA